MQELLPARQLPAPGGPGRVTLTKPLHIVQPPGPSIDSEENEEVPAEAPPARGPWPVGP